MNKNKLNYYIDLLLIVCLIIVSITGLVLLFAFESGIPKAGKLTTFLGIYKSDWVIWHNFFGLTMIILMSLHLILHWNWLTCMTRNLFSKSK